MSVTDIRKDPETMTMTITAAFEAPLQRVWEVWESPRLLERWWGPPTYPATVVDHDLTPGGLVTYYMTGPEGDRYRGWWRVLAVEAPRHLEFEDGFSDEEGNPNPEMPTVNVTVELREERGGRTEMTLETVFPSQEAMEQLIAMGMEEGITGALGQIDQLLEVEPAPK